MTLVDDGMTPKMVTCLHYPSRDTIDLNKSSVLRELSGFRAGHALGAAQGSGGHVPSGHGHTLMVDHHQ